MGCDRKNFYCEMTLCETVLTVYTLKLVKFQISDQSADEQPTGIWRHTSPSFVNMQYMFSQACLSQHNSINVINVAVGLLLQEFSAIQIVLILDFLNI